MIVRVLLLASAVLAGCTSIQGAWDAPAKEGRLIVAVLLESSSPSQREEVKDLIRDSVMDVLEEQVDRAAAVKACAWWDGQGSDVLYVARRHVHRLDGVEDVQLFDACKAALESYVRRVGTERSPALRLRLLRDDGIFEEAVIARKDEPE